MSAGRLDKRAAIGAALGVGLAAVIGKALMRTQAIALPSHDEEYHRAPRAVDRAAGLMKAVVYHGKEDIRVEDVIRPRLSEPDDAIIRVTNTAICGSDLHLYHGEIPGMRDGDIMGHEFMGIVEEVGPGVYNLKPGDRVVVSAIIADGTCWFCQQGLFSQCETTNPNPIMQKIYGQHTAGIFGYSHFMGGYMGGHAEYVRVPFANVGCLRIPDEVTDDQAVLLGDTACTGWMAADNGGVKLGVSVAVFGCGPIGLMTMEAARAMGAERIFAIDPVLYRMNVARQRFGAETIDTSREDPVERLRELTHGRGPDICIDAVGFRYPKTWRHAVQKQLKLETDSIDALSDAIRSVRKGGTVSIIGDYIGLANQFPVGAMMEKGLTVRSGQVHVQRYWRPVLERIQGGQIDPSFLISHHMPLERAAEAYRVFDRKENGVLKIVLNP